jgi:hypothetical protein
MYYHYDSIDRAIEGELDRELSNLLQSDPTEGNSADMREEFAKKCTERIVKIFHQAIVAAYTVGAFNCTEGAETSCSVQFRRTAHET